MPFNPIKSLFSTLFKMISLRQAAKLVPFAIRSGKNLQARTLYGGWRGGRNRRNDDFDFSDIMRDFQRSFQDLERSFDRAFNQVSGTHIPSLLRPSSYIPMLGGQSDTRDLPVQDGQDAVDSAPRKFRIKLDMRGFQPKDVNVQVDEEDRIIKLKAATCGQQSDGSVVSREYAHEYAVPDDVDLNEAICTFDEHHYLTIEAPFQRNVNELPQTGPKVAEIKIDRGKSASSGSLGQGGEQQAGSTGPNPELDKPIEQRVPTPGDDEFPKDTTDDLRHN